jgi:hypothetical protein
VVVGEWRRHGDTKCVKNYSMPGGQPSRDGRPQATIDIYEISLSCVLLIRINTEIKKLCVTEAGGGNRARAYGEGWPWTPYSFIRARPARPFYTL